MSPGARQVSRWLSRQADRQIGEAVSEDTWSNTLFIDTGRKSYSVPQPPSEDFKMRQEWKHSLWNWLSLDLLFWVPALTLWTLALQCLPRHSHKACVHSTGNREDHPQNADPFLTLCPDRVTCPSNAPMGVFLGTGWSPKWRKKKAVAQVGM
jgi:hypothetical protein